MDYTVGDTIYFKFTTRGFSDGVPDTLAGTPVLSAYEDASVTQITAGVSVTVDLDSVTGLNLATIVATGGNGFEAGKHYGIVITTGTVGGTSIVGEVIGQFTLSKSAAAVELANGTDGLSALKTLIDALNDLSAANVASELATYDGPTKAEMDAAHALLTTPAQVATELGTYDGPTKAEMDAAHALLATPAQVATELGTYDGPTKAEMDTAHTLLATPAQVNTEVDNSMVTYGLDHLVQTSVTGTDVADNSIIAKIVDDAATADWDNYDPTTASLEALNVDTDAIVADLANGVDGLSALKSLIDGLLDPSLADIADAVWDEAKAGHVAAGSFGEETQAHGLSSEISGLNDLSAANVNAEVVDALDTDTYAELAAVPAATSTLVDKINWLFILARNKLTQTAGTQLVRNDADAGTVGTSTVSDDATTATRGEFS